MADTDQQCLASAIHYEAGGESLDGKRAVYEVIMHRAQVAKQSVCGVVKAPGQFSWVGFKPFLPLTKEAEQLLRRIKAMPTLLPSSTQWFFTTTIRVPKWARSMSCQVIGHHRFCEKENNGGREGNKEVPRVPDSQDTGGILSGKTRESGQGGILQALCVQASDQCSGLEGKEQGTHTEVQGQQP